MKFENIIKCSIIIGLINAISALTLRKREHMDDYDGMYTRECRMVTTLNLEIINECLQYLSEPSISEEELDSLCESFKDYYAKDNETGTDTEAETDVEIDDIGDEIFNLNLDDLGIDNKENRKIVQISNITEKEGEEKEKTIHILNKIIVKENAKSLNKTKLNKRGNNFCKVFVKKWNFECRNISRIAPTINAALENYYFRRQSFCLKNSENRYCTILVNEMKRKAFNNTGEIVQPLNEDQSASTCECFKRKMDYLKEEYYSSKDPEVVKIKKNYSKNRKLNEEAVNSNQKRDQQSHFNEEKKEDRKEKHLFKNNKFWNKIGNFMFSYFPRIGVYERPRYAFPFFNELNMNMKVSQEQQYNQDFLNEINKLINPSLRFNKRMVNEMNIKELKKQIINYQKEMDELIDTSTCNATFTYVSSRRSDSGSLALLSSKVFLMIILSGILIQYLFL
jgi:hypothetical protein